MLLVADIGATSARLQAADPAAGNALVAERSYASNDFPDLVTVIETFTREFRLPAVGAACLGLPGPVQGRCAQLTNLPWRVDAAELERACGIKRVELINDFQAAAHGIDVLQPEQRVLLHAGKPDPSGHRLVAGAGTGLGVAPVMHCAGRHIPVACEGGHMSFAPADAVQQELLAWLRQQWPHVSFERILSGSGLETLYSFFSGLEHPDQAGEVSAEQVTARAAQKDPVAEQALTTFAAVYGSFLGSAALLWPARGGIYIAGGIAAKIQPWLQTANFLQALQDKGRMRPVLEKMPVYLITDTKLGLKGALLRAQLLLDDMTRRKE